MCDSLDGARVLVVEDRCAIAIALCDAIEDCGGTVVGPAARLAQALDLIGTADVDVGVLDVDLDGEASYPAAMALCERGAPVILLTGYDPHAMPPELAGAEVLQKPVVWSDLVHRLAVLVRAGTLGR